MDLIYELFLVFIKNCMSAACFLQDIEGIENSWFHSMTDIKICYRAMIEFLTLENIQPQQIHN